jgi:hypothetical protein
MHKDLQQTGEGGGGPDAPHQPAASGSARPDGGRARPIASWDEVQERVAIYIPCFAMILIDSVFICLLAVVFYCVHKLIAALALRGLPNLVIQGMELCFGLALLFVAIRVGAVDMIRQMAAIREERNRRN